MSVAAQLSANDVALELTGRDYVSFSAISAYRRCSLAYRLRYLDGLPEESLSISLLFGGAIHSAAEHHFNELMTGNPPPDLDGLLSAFWASWHARGNEATIQFAKGEDIDGIGQMADRLLRAFQQDDIARPQGRILGVEEELRGRLSTTVPDLLARIDLLVETDASLIITDLKTARSRWAAEQAQDSAEQLLLYGELAQQLIPDKEVRLEFVVITKTKKPVIDRLPVPNDPQRRARAKRIVEHVWRAIQAGHFFPTPSPIACGCCPYRQACQAWPEQYRITTKPGRIASWSPF